MVSPAPPTAPTAPTADVTPDAKVTVAAFYRFVPRGALGDLEALKAAVEAEASGALKGSVLLADEGINGTVAGPAASVEALLASFRAWAPVAASDERPLAILVPKFSTASTMPFQRLKVEIKPEIVTLRRPEVDPTRRVGTYVAPTDWNALVDDPEVVVVDTRNDFEVGLGTFVGATNPKTTSFSAFPDFVDAHLDPAVHTKVAMFCTGGIRCEKATALLLERGFQEVLHLEGGILRYLEEVPATESRWQGECFVFDERVSVGHGLEVGQARVCHACYGAVDVDGQKSPHYEEGVSCAACVGTASAKKLASLRERQKQLMLKRERSSGSEGPQPGASKGQR